MALLDHNGVAILVGDTVKLQGTVLSIDQSDTHYGEIKIQISFPVAGVPNPEVAGFAPTIEGANIHGPKAAQIIKCSPGTLTH